MKRVQSKEEKYLITCIFMLVAIILGILNLESLNVQAESISQVDLVLTNREQPDREHPRAGEPENYRVEKTAFWEREQFEFREIRQPEFDALRVKEKPEWFDENFRFSNVKAYREVSYHDVSVTLNDINSYSWLPTATFSPVVDASDSGELTSIYGRDLSPHLLVHPATDDVEAWDFEPNTTISLTIGTFTDSQLSDGAGSVHFYVEPFDIQPGQLVEMNDGVHFEGHLVRDFTFDVIDPDMDTVSGTAEPGSELATGVWWDGGSVWATPNPIADGSGLWSADFSGLADIVPGMGGWANQWDEDGDETQVHWYLPNPHLDVRPEDDSAGGWEWLADTLITLTYDTNTYHATSNSNGEVNFENLGFDVQVGDYFEMTDGSTTKSYAVLPLSLSSYDVETDIVSGTADPDCDVEVFVCENGFCTWGEATADSGGNWTVDFTGTKDIEPGMHLHIRRWDDDGDSTSIYENIPLPQIDARPAEDSVGGWEWPGDTEITLTVDTSTYYATSNSSGDVNFWNLGFDLQAGDVLEMSDGVTTKTHTVLPLSISSYDVEADTMSGIAAASSEVWAWVCEEGYCTSTNTFADGSGNWAVDFTGLMDMEPGMWLIARCRDEDRDATSIYKDILFPQIDARPEEDSVGGWDWPGDTEITLTIDTNTYHATSNSYGDVNFWNLGYDLQAGDNLEMTDGTTIKTHTVFPLEIIGSSVDDDTISGTADPGSLVDVWACWDDNHSCSGIDTYADGSGDWTVDFTGTVDIVAGTGFGARRWDEDTDVTSIYGHVPNPAFDVNPDEDDVWGWDWPADTEITLIFDSVPYTTTSDSTGHFNFNQLLVDLVEGDALEVNDGMTYKTHTILALSLDTVDEASDTVSGTATPGSEVWSYACDSDNCDGMWVTADTNGDYSADMSTIGIDIGPGARGNVRQADEDDDGTCIGWDIPSPHILAHPESDDIQAWNLLPDTTIELTITGGGDYTDTALSDSTGWVRFDLLPFDLQPGHLVEVFDGESLDSHVVIDFTIDNIDPDTDTVSGTAEPGSELAVYAWYNSEFLGWASPNPITDGAGDWTADFSGVADIRPGVSGGVNQWDEDGDETQVHWHLPNPRIRADMVSNRIYGRDWLANTEVTLTIGGDHWTEQSDEWGWVFFNFDSFEVQPGQFVEMTDGTNTKTYTVVDLAVTSYDEGGETLSGTADPGELEVYAYDDMNSEGLFPTADGSGNWTAEFAVVDIAAGSFAYLYQFDEDGDLTQNFWYIPDPYMVVYPEENQVIGGLWPAKTEITLTINSDSRETWIGESNSFGSVIFELEGFELLPEQVVEMSDETFTQIHIVANLTVDEIDQDLDTVFGTAEPLSDVEACAYLWVGQNYSSHCLTTSADGQGDWLADFSGSVDISLGAWGSAAQYDDDDDATVVNWEVPADNKIFLPLIVK